MKVHSLSKTKTTKRDILITIGPPAQKKFPCLPLDFEANEESYTGFSPRKGNNHYPELKSTAIHVCNGQVHAGSVVRLSTRLLTWAVRDSLGVSRHPNMDSAVSSTETRPAAACLSVTTLTEGQQRSDADWFVMTDVVGELCSHF